MPRSSKRKEKVLIIIARLSVIAAIIVVGLVLYLDRVPESPKKEQSIPTPVLAPEKEPGYSVYFVDKYKIGFLFPEEQDPIKANTEITRAIDSVKTRDFTISLHTAPEFRYAPWPSTPQVCGYDGALGVFQPLDGRQCDLTADSSFLPSLVYTGSFQRGSDIKHVYLLPVQNRKYFLEFSAVYTADCSDDPGTPVSVCDARSEQKRSKLEAFVRSVAVKNHELFGRQ